MQGLPYGGGTSLGRPSVEDSGSASTARTSLDHHQSRPPIVDAARRLHLQRLPWCWTRQGSILKRSARFSATTSTDRSPTPRTHRLLPGRCRSCGGGPRLVISMAHTAGLRYRETNRVDPTVLADAHQRIFSEYLASNALFPLIHGKVPTMHGKARKQKCRGASFEILRLSCTARAV